MQELEKDVLACQQQLAELQRQSAEEEKALSTTMATKTSLEKTLKEVQDKVEMAKADLSAQEEGVSHVRDECEALKEKVRAAERELAQWEQQRTDTQQSFEALQDEVNRMKAEEASHRNEVTAIAQEMSSTKRDIERLNKEKNVQLAMRETALQSLRQAKEELQRQQEAYRLLQDESLPEDAQKVQEELTSTQSATAQWQAKIEADRRAKSAAAGPSSSPHSSSLPPPTVQPNRRPCRRPSNLFRSVCPRPTFSLRRRWRNSQVLHQRKTPPPSPGRVWTAIVRSSCRQGERQQALTSHRSLQKHRVQQW